MNPVQRKIIHIDMDCFYAAVEMRDKPEWKNKPLAVGGRPEGRGVITTANYEARKYGVKSALSCREAVRRCPDLILVPNRFQKYKEVSGQIREIFRRHSDIIEPLSLDEAYIDVSNSKEFKGSATMIAFAIREQIYNELDLTASAGIAPNKFLAKVASDWKKPNGQFTIRPDEAADFCQKLPLKKIPGIGKVTQKKLASKGFETCNDLLPYSIAEMEHLFGRFGLRMYDLIRGIDHSKVKSQRTRKSISVETTLYVDTKDWNEIKKRVESLFDELCLRMKKANINSEKLKSLGIKFKTSEFQIYSKERACDFNLNSFLKIAEDLHLENSESIRLIGLSGKIQSSSSKQQRSQMALF